jgi:hypothetical protein
MQIVKIVTLLLLSLCVGSASADVVSAKGKATVTYTEHSANSDTKAKALDAAQMKAIEFYFAEAGDAESENLDAIRGKIKADPDRFILDSTLLSEEDKPDDHRYTVTVRVSLNGSNLRNALKSVSAIGTTPQVAKSQLAFIFVSRQVATQTTFDARVTKRVALGDQGSLATSTSDRGTEGESIKSSQVSTNAFTNKKASYDAQRMVTVESGGSSVARAGRSTWELIPSQNLNQVVTEVFKTSGYRVAEAQYIEPLSGGMLKVSAIENDYKSGNDLRSSTLQNVVTGLRTAQVRYFALGTLDVGAVSVDPATGLQRIAVTVNAKVIDVGQGIPEDVAVAGPSQYSGVGPTEDEARTNAMKLAAENAAHELTSQLANAGLH